MSYALQYAPGLRDAKAWTTLTNLTLSAPTQTWSDPDSSNRNAGFYRALQLR